MSFPSKEIAPRQTIRRKPVPSRFERRDIKTTSDHVSVDRLGKEALKVLAHVHLYPPVHNAGAEWMLHALLKYGLDNRGWDVQVLTDHLPARSDSFQGIRVRHDRNISTVSIEYRFSNVIITHLDMTRKAMEISGRQGRPLVHLVHNDMQLAFNRVTRKSCALAVFNSQWLKDAVQWDGPSIIMHPPTRMADYEIKLEGDKVTLINLSPAKGVDVFYDAVERNPNINFLGVKGSYGEQVLPIRDFPNLEIWDNQPDIKEVYRQTKILLMPSHYESWGRVAVEAACSGIPTICSPTPGLLEAGVGADYCDPLKARSWSSAINRLMRSDAVWNQASEEAKARAIELDLISEQQLLETAEHIESLA